EALRLEVPLPRGRRIRLAWLAADGEHRRARLDRAGLSTRRRVAEKHDRPGGRIERVAVQLERGAAGEHDVHLLVTERLLLMALDHPLPRPVGGGCVP